MNLKRIDDINVNVKNYDLVSDFCMPDYTPLEYPCKNCGTKMKLKQKRVLYCKFCHVGFLHPKYDFGLDVIKSSV